MINRRRSYRSLSPADVHQLAKILTHGSHTENSSVGNAIAALPSRLRTSVPARCLRRASACGAHRALATGALVSLLHALRDVIEKGGREGAFRQVMAADVERVTRDVRETCARVFNGRGWRLAFCHRSRECPACLLGLVVGDGSRVRILGALLIGTVRPGAWENSVRISFLQACLRRVAAEGEADAEIASMWRLGKDLRQARKSARACRGLLYADRLARRSNQGNSADACILSRPIKEEEKPAEDSELTAEEAKLVGLDVGKGENGLEHQIPSDSAVALEASARTHKAALEAAPQSASSVYSGGAYFVSTQQRRQTRLHSMERASHAVSNTSMTESRVIAMYEDPEFLSRAWQDEQPESPFRAQSGEAKDQEPRWRGELAAMYEDLDFLSRAWQNEQPESPCRAQSGEAKDQEPRWRGGLAARRGTRPLWIRRPQSLYDVAE